MRLGQHPHQVETTRGSSNGTACVAITELVSQAHTWPIPFVLDLRMDAHRIGCTDADDTPVHTEVMRDHHATCLTETALMPGAIPPISHTFCYRALSHCTCIAPSLDLLNVLDGLPRTDTNSGRGAWSRAQALLRRDRLCARARAAVEQIRRDTRGPEGVAIGRLSGRGPLGGPFDRHAIQADAEITRV